MWDFDADKRLRDKRLADLEVKVGIMAGQIEALRAVVEAQRTVNESAIALINGMSARLSSALATNDLSEVAAIVEDMRANVDALAGAVAANTEAAPAPVVAPAVEPVVEPVVEPAPAVEAPAEAVVEAPAVDPEAPVA